MPYRAIYVVDTEYFGEAGDIITPVCLVVRDLVSGTVQGFWQDELLTMHRAPFDTGPEALFVSFFAPAELGFFKALGWPMPERIFDCYAEFRCETNGQILSHGKSLLGAMLFFGLETIEAEAKKDMRSLILSGGPWDDNQKSEIINYCITDVDALARLFPCMINRWIIDDRRLGQALLRGRYMAAVACMEHAGIPIDVPLLKKFWENWDRIKHKLISRVDSAFNVYTDGHFKEALFENYLIQEGIPWPRHESGRLALDRDTFKMQKNTYPKLAPLYYLRNTLAELRHNGLTIGRDGRNRAMLSPFGSKTGRNQPSTSKFIFGSPAWVRGFIKPAPGFSLAYCDWRSQEIAVAAARSADQAMWNAYASGDIYIAFAIGAGLAPLGATKASHRTVREQCKAIVLGLQYGMTPIGIARGSTLLFAEAQDLVRRHRETYPGFWRWVRQNVDAALFGLPLNTCFGWKIQTGYGTDPKERTFMNWPMQSDAAEMLRIACCLATEAGLTVAAPIHDAILLEASTDRIYEDVDRLKHIMQEASELVLGEGKICGVDVNIIHYPNRFQDERGAEMWDIIMKLLDDV